MTDRRFDPTRRCRPPEEWPTQDRAAWCKACAMGTVLKGHGPAANWSRTTKASREKAYGRLLNYLDEAGRLDAGAGLATLVSPDHIVGYVARLEAQGVASSSIWSYLSHLCNMARVMAPEVDWRWLRDVVNRLHGAATPARPIAPHLVPLRRRIKAGYALMREAKSTDRLPPLLRAGRFRDGLMLVLQSQRALRLANLTMIRIGKHLIRHSDGYWLQFEAAEMKARRYFEVPVPVELTEAIDRYLGHWRPVLLQGGTTDALWLTQAGRAMQSYSVASRMIKLTRRLFGKTMSTHKFRHGLASHIADEMPDQIRMAMPMLSHKQFSTTNRYIVKAHSLKASRRQNVHLKELRRELAEQLRNGSDLRAAGHGTMKRSYAKRS